MKKMLVLFVLLAIGFGIWLFLKKEPQPITITPEIDQSSAKELKTNMVQAVSNVSKSTNASGITEPINALTATNLEQWKTLIPGLKYSDNFGRWDSWVMEQTNHLTGVPILFEENGRKISYKIQFIDVRIFSDSEQVRKVQMHSPMMNIDETRELGLQLCEMLGVDSTGFSEWCDKVGNHWMDAPLYATGKGIYGFQILNTFGNEKPWYINFVIQN